MHAFKIALILAFAAAAALPATAQNLELLSYGNETPAGGVALMNGHAVSFSAPGENWTLSKIALCAKLNPGKSDLFLLEIWDQNLRTLYRSTDQASYYFGDNFTWREIDLPDMLVPRNFVVCLFEFSNLYLGVDKKNQSTGRSMVVGRSANRILPWDLNYSQNQTEWMIAALGYPPSLPPQVNLTAKTREQGLALQVQASDPDGDLASETVYVLEANGDAVWSERKLLRGPKEDTEIIWSGDTFKASNQSLSLGPVHALNMLNISAAEAPYAVYTVPVLLRIGPQEPVLFMSGFFSADGNLHALIDDTGNFYYLSQELLKVLKPSLTYGKYMESNLSLKEFQSTLTFLKYNQDQGLIRLQTLALSRSPMQHFGIELEKAKAPAGDYHGMVKVSDAAGNMAEKIAKP